MYPATWPSGKLVSPFLLGGGYTVVWFQDIAFTACQQRRDNVARSSWSRYCRQRHSQSEAKIVNTRETYCDKTSGFHHFDPLWLQGGKVWSCGMWGMRTGKVEHRKSITNFFADFQSFAQKIQNKYVSWFFRNFFSSYDVFSKEIRSSEEFPWKLNRITPQPYQDWFFWPKHLFQISRTEADFFL